MAVGRGKIEDREIAMLVPHRRTEGKLTVNYGGGKKCGSGQGSGRCHRSPKEITCDKPGTKVMRAKMKVLSKVRFTKKRIHPVEGIWREETHVILCGKSMDVNVTVVATPNSSPAFIAKED